MSVTLTLCHQGKGIRISLLRASYLATQKSLPIGIILSFVLLTSMKLPSLVYFFVKFFFFFTMLYIVTILGAEAYLVKGLIGCMSFPLMNLPCALLEKELLQCFWLHCTVEIMFTAEDNVSYMGLNKHSKIAAFKSDSTNSFMLH